MQAYLATGEPVELARRFCIANRFYGSRVLLGPRTFELASKILVARPIDFLSGVAVCNTGHCHPRVVAAIEHRLGARVPVDVIAREAEESSRLVERAIDSLGAGASDGITR